MTRPPAKPTPNAARRGPLPAIFAALFGALLALCLVKFGNPIILDKLVDQPTNFYEWLLAAWPVVYARYMLLVVLCVGLAAARWKTGKIPPLLLALPAAWLVWEFLAGTQTVSSRLTEITLVHFATCVICFYLGFFALAPARPLWPFWLALLAGFFIVLAVGFEQHFGGLAEMRRYFYLYDYPDPGKPPPAEFVARMASNRIFSTLLYPNTLASVILLLLPPLAATLWSLERRFTVGARRFLVGAITAAALACLVWSGSKGGWLLMLVTGLVATLILPFKRRLKLALIAAVIILGLAGFALKYAGYFRRGATSVSARFDYWRAAGQIFNQRPVFGTGPGTFVVSYARVKKPESEMARLTHNDYLQQACDSGVLGFLLYAAFVVSGLVYAYRRGNLRADPMRLAVWLSLLAWALQSTMEFGLYIPAIAWPAFGLMGWLLGSCSNEIDTRPSMG